MQQDNYDYLLQQLESIGFQGLDQDLKARMESNSDKFSLQYHSKSGDSDISAHLVFHKSDYSEKYFFNSYTLGVSQDEGITSLDQVFYIGFNNDRITLPEALNMLDGRAVLKEWPQPGTWVMLDFKQTDCNGNFAYKTFNPQYAFDLEAALKKYPIKEMETDDAKKALLESLHKGNRHSATYIQGDKELKVFIEAAPQFKAIKFYDMNMHRLKQKNLVPEGAQTLNNKTEQGELLVKQKTQSRQAGRNRIY